MPAITLSEASKAASDNGEEKIAAVYKVFAKESDIMRTIRVAGMSGNAITYSQEGELPTVAFRGVGEGFVAGGGVLNTQTDSLKIVGGEVDLDRFDYTTQGPESLADQVTMKLKALSIGMTSAIMTGAESSDPAYFDGLQTRITETSQLIDNGLTSGGDPLSLKKLDRLIEQVSGCTHLIMSPLMKLRFAAAFRSSTFPNIVMDKDATGQQVYMYGNLPILVGYPLASKNTGILPFTESGGGGGTAHCTSIYGVNFNEGGVQLRSNGGISVRDLGEQNSGPTLKTRIEWYVTLVDFSQYARARLRGITDTDIVA
jgi:hypothetical protein